MICFTPAESLVNARSISSLVEKVSADFEDGDIALFSLSDFSAGSRNTCSVNLK